MNVSSTDSIDPGKDFNGYMNEQGRIKREEIAYEAKLSAHEEWRQNTWSGWFVRQTLRVTNYYIRPFIFPNEGSTSTITASNQQNDDETINVQRLVSYICIRMTIVFTICTIFWIVTKTIQFIIGGNGTIEMIEEVVIVHEHDTEEEASKARLLQQQQAAIQQQQATANEFCLNDNKKSQ